MAEDLDLAARIVQVDEHAAVADRPDAAGDAYRVGGLVARRQRCVTLLQRRRIVATLVAGRIRFDAELAQRVELGKTDGAQRVAIVPWAVIHPVRRPLFRRRRDLWTEIDDGVVEMLERAVMAD